MMVAYPRFIISSFTIHRFMFISLSTGTFSSHNGIGTKFISDVYPSNKHFSSAGGMSLEEMNVVELEFWYNDAFL